MGMDFNLRDQLTFYGSYHANKWNQLVHFVFVPIIFWSVAVWMSYTPAFFTYDVSAHLPDCAPAWLLTASQHLVFNGAFAQTMVYGLSYIVLEPFAGGTWLLAVGLPTWVTAVAFQSLVPRAWAWALLAHVFSWFMQIVPGHAWAEKRKPALLTSFCQSLWLANLFVWFELLFHLGYRPALYADLKARIAKSIEEDKKQREPLLSSAK